MRYEAECYTQEGINNGYIVSFAESFPKQENARAFANHRRLDRRIVMVDIVDTDTGEVVETIHRV